MKVTFAATPTPATRLVARIVDQDGLPADLPVAMLQGAEMSRFSGKVGQVFEGFHEAGGVVVRQALVDGMHGGVLAFTIRPSQK